MARIQPKTRAAVIESMAHKKPFLPTKTCHACGRPFDWRKKWEKVWEEVKYCSDRCRHAPRKKKTASQ